MGMDEFSVSGVSLKDLSPAEFSRLWALWDESLEMAPEQRDAWLAEAAKRGKFPMLCNGDERYPVTITGLERPARLTPGGQPQFEVHARLPLDAAVIAAGCEATRKISNTVAPGPNLTAATITFVDRDHGKDAGSAVDVWLLRGSEEMAHLHAVGTQFDPTVVEVFLGLRGEIWSPSAARELLAS